MNLLEASVCMILFTVGCHLPRTAAQNDFANHECNRPCNGTTKTCYYTLTVEHYSTMGKACRDFPYTSSGMESKPVDCVIGDGVARHLYTVNRNLPSPQIRVCQGDTIKATLVNDMTNGETTTMHWHGIHQKGSAYMDGVPMVTQCPLLPFSNEFLYEFVADRAGSHYYHAHVGMQRGEGIAGPFIVRPTEQRTDLPDHKDLAEHTILIQDWFNHSATDKGTVHLHDGGTNHPDSLIVNGAAPYEVSRPMKNDPRVQETARIPHQVFNVQKNEVYRFRIISNGVMNCPIEVYMDGHNLDVIATDGADIRTTAAKVLVVSGGERWDFLLTANQSTANYWIYFRGIVDCNDTALQTLAVLHYQGAYDANSWSATYRKQRSYANRPDAVTVNPFMGETSPKLSPGNSIFLTDLKPHNKSPDWLRGPVDVKKYLEIGLNQLDNKFYNKPSLYPCRSADNPGDPEADGRITGCMFLAQIDKINGMMPKSNLYTQAHHLDPSLLCEVGSKKSDNCENELCYCIHYMKVEVGQVVELVLVDVGRYFNNSNHPMHIHGQYFYVVAEGQNDWYQTTKQEVIDKDDENGEGPIPRNLVDPIEKDTIMMPTGGWVIVRFKATNPGPWLFHCHNELHVEQGMFMVIQVGDPSSWPENPYKAYPCGPYHPPPSQAHVTTTGTLPIARNLTGY